MAQAMWVLPASGCITAIRLEGTIIAVNATQGNPSLEGTPLAFIVPGSTWVTEGNLMMESHNPNRGSDFEGALMLGGVPFLSWASSLAQAWVESSSPADPGEGDFEHGWALASDEDNPSGFVVSGIPEGVPRRFFPEFSMSVKANSGYRPVIPCNADSPEGLSWLNFEEHSQFSLTVRDELDGASAYVMYSGRVTSITVVPESRVPILLAVGGAFLFRRSGKRRGIVWA